NDFSVILSGQLGAVAFSTVPKPSKCSPRCDVTKCPSPICLGGYVPDHCNCCLVCVRAEGDACGAKNDPPCGQGLECKLLSSPCKTTHRVCGSDGKTYGNVCKLRAASRKVIQKGLPAERCVLVAPGRVALHPNSARYRFNFIADVVEKIAPAVVHIELYLRHPLYGRNVPLSSGSGFVMTQSGLIVTNAHVVTPAATVTGRPHVRVRLHSGEAYEATIRDLDRKSDIATIKVTAEKKLPVLSLGRSADVRPGEFVVAIGSPFALQNTVTTGIVSTTQRDGKELGIRDSDIDYIQTDAIINVSSRWKPDGEVIGINTLKVTAGISFAIPADRIKRFLTESQNKNKEAKRRILGIQMLTLTELSPAVSELRAALSLPQTRSALSCSPSVPRSGIQIGDVIVQLNGRPLLTADGLHAALLGDKPLLLEVRRERDELLFSIQPQLILH
uniref:HtrA serine peptidase 3a n=1 Tax=Gadus morhua TaxID=8049 RepID=A0A8C4ZHQ7_GADMO